MKKRQSALLLGLLTFGALSAEAQTATPATAPAPSPAYSISADFAYASAYVFRGVRLAKGAFQPAVKLTAGEGYVGVWANAPAERGYELEIDYFAGYGIPLNDTWSLDAGLTVYSYPRLDSGDKTTYEGYLGLNGSLGVLSTGTYAYHDVTLKASTLQESLGHTFELDSRTSIHLLATVGHVAPDAGGGYTYYGFGVTVPYKLSDAATLTVGVQSADHDISGVEGRHVWGTIDLGYSF